MGGDSVDRLTDIILQMKINMAHISETLHQQTFEIGQQLAVIFEDEKKGLESCLGGIDAKLMECSVQVEDYQRRYAALALMGAKLVQLGMAPSALPAALPDESMEGFLAWRIKELKEQGKI